MSGDGAEPQAAEALSPGPVQDFWSEDGTTPDQIDDALRQLLHQRYADDEGVAPARVLNLVVVVDRDWKGEVSNRLARVGRYHASRTVLCAVEEGRTQLDAWAAISVDEPQDGISVIHEQLEIDVGPEHLPRLDAVIDPVIVADLPTVLWSPHGHPEAVDSLRRMVDVMLLDSDDGADEPGETLERADELLGSAYVVDLAWLRTTPWRERLASSFDPEFRRAALRELDEITIRHRASSTASALLLAGWLTSRLGWQADRLEGAGRDRLEGVARSSAQEVKVALEAAEQDVPGLAGVTVSAGDFTLSLDRQPGGLRACERRGEQERVWQVLGASRGEGGILGEGVRQAHLRDPTYGPALEASRAMCPA